MKFLVAFAITFTSIWASADRGVIQVQVNGPQAALESIIGRAPMIREAINRAVAIKQDPVISQLTREIQDLAVQLDPNLSEVVFMISPARLSYGREDGSIFRDYLVTRSWILLGDRDLLKISRMSEVLEIAPEAGTADYPVFVFRQEDTLSGPDLSQMIRGMETFRGMVREAVLNKNKKEAAMAKTAEEVDRAKQKLRILKSR